MDSFIESQFFVEDEIIEFVVCNFIEFVREDVKGFFVNVENHNTKTIDNILAILS